MHCADSTSRKPPSSAIALRSAGLGLDLAVQSGLRNLRDHDRNAPGICRCLRVSAHVCSPHAAAANGAGDGNRHDPLHDRRVIQPGQARR